MNPNYVLTSIKLGVAVAMMIMIMYVLTSIWARVSELVDTLSAVS